MMATVIVEPGYQELLRQHGLTTFAAVTGLPALVVGCHPGRHVARVTLGSGAATVPAFLKRERRVSWADRLANWWAGFGFVSNSLREARLLRELRRTGVGCPDVIACGEDSRGGAFLLVRATGFVELRTFLRDHLPHGSRRCFARMLGAALARIHAAGFDHPDLYSKHVLVSPETGAVVFVDWQRSHRRRQLSSARRCRDLAALDATLSDELATSRERLLCLRAYLQSVALPRRRQKAFARRIRACSLRLQGRRRVRELRQEPLPEGAQDLVPLQGGIVYASPALLAGTTRPPRVLGYAGFPQGRTEFLERTVVLLPAGGRGLLVRRRVERPRGWLWAWLRGRAPLSPERQQADALFRLQRYGVAAPRLLAYGQRQETPWRQESLLLVEMPSNAVSLAGWLAHCDDPAARCRVLGEVGRLLRRIHRAGYYLGPAWTRGDVLLVSTDDKEETRVLLATVENLEVRRQPSGALAARDVEHFRSFVEGAGATRVNALSTTECGAEA